MTTPASLQERLTAAIAERDALNTAYNALTTYDAALRALGPEPVVPVAVAAPASPKTPRPTPDDVADARETLRQRDVAAGEARRVKIELDTATSEHARLAREQEEAKAEANRTSSLLSLARSAPSDLFREGIALLDLPPGIEITAPEREHDKSPHVRVTVDGHLWGDAGVSNGRQLTASLEFRDRVRRAAAARVDKSFRWLPIVADNATDWNGGAGPWPAVDGPVYWCLTTAPGTKLTVRSGMPGGAS